METISISKHTDKAIAEISLSGSKSISNRCLIIRALSGTDFDLENLSKSKDTVTLDSLLNQNEDVYDAGHAGTTFRFLCSYLALQKGTQTLTGSARMLERPIGPLVKALKDLGFNISYLGKEGYPPLKIGEINNSIGDVVSMDGTVSSQFLSSLLLIAPYLPKGLKLNIEGDLVSRPYLEMTLKLMKRFGADYTFEGNSIQVLPGKYVGQDMFVEGDWSSASYLYLSLSMQEEGEIRILGLEEDSLQGDSKMSHYAEKFSITTVFEDRSVIIRKTNETLSPLLEFNLIEQPDLCQTLVAMCAGNGVQGIFSGLQTLKIKETDRVAALGQEMKKFNVSFSPLPKQFSSKSEDSFYMLNGKVERLEEEVSIATYDDHRMAMAFAPLSKITPLMIEDYMVVKKSYPDYWNDLEKLGYLFQDGATEGRSD